MDTSRRATLNRVCFIQRLYRGSTERLDSEPEETEMDVSFNGSTERALKVCVFVRLAIA